MKKYVLYIGLNDKDSKIQKIDSIEAFKMVQNICLQHTDGATIYNASGIYKHEDGTVVIENTLRVELLFIELTAVKSIASTIKIVLNQESIVLQEQDIESSLI